MKIPPLALLLSLGCLVSCSPEPRSSPVSQELEQHEDHLFYLKGQSVPYTGEYVKVAKNGLKTESASYRDGKLHGPLLVYRGEESVKRRTDYLDGKRIRKRVWYENGQLKADETWDEDKVFGPCAYWFEDGRLRKQMRVSKDYQPEGHVLEYAENGEVLLDVIVNQARIISGKWKPGTDKLVGERYASEETDKTAKETPKEKIIAQP